MNIFDLNMSVEIDQAWIAFRDHKATGLANFLDITEHTIDKSSKELHKKPLLSLDYTEFQFLVTQLIYRKYNIVIPTNTRQAKHMISSTGRLILAQINHELQMGKITLEKLKKLVPPQLYLYFIEASQQNLLQGTSETISQSHIDKLPMAKAAQEEYDRNRSRSAAVHEQASVYKSPKGEVRDIPVTDIVAPEEENLPIEQDETLDTELDALTTDEVNKDQVITVGQAKDRPFGLKARIERDRNRTNPQPLEIDPLADLL